VNWWQVGAEEVRRGWAFTGHLLGVWRMKVERAMGHMDLVVGHMDLVIGFRERVGGMPGGPSAELIDGYQSEATSTVSSPGTSCETL